MSSKTFPSIYVDTLNDLPEMDGRGRLFHTNHLLLAHRGVADAGWLSDSPARQQRVRQLALEHDCPVGLADITRVSDDHEGFPYSICRYEKGPLGMDATLFSIAIDLGQKRAVVHLGTPCHAEETIVLRSLNDLSPVFRARARAGSPGFPA